MTPYTPASSRRAAVHRSNQRAVSDTIHLLDGAIEEAACAVAADASVAPDVSADEAAVVEHTAKPVPGGAKTSAELLEVLSGREVGSPLCFTCGTKMRPAAAATSAKAAAAPSAAAKWRRSYS